MKPQARVADIARNLYAVGEPGTHPNEWTAHGFNPKYPAYVIAATLEEARILAFGYDITNPKTKKRYQTPVALIPMDKSRLLAFVVPAVYK